MKIDSGEDFLALLNRLLEGLHQAGMTNFGSHLSIVYVACTSLEKVEWFLL